MKLTSYCLFLVFFLLKNGLFAQTTPSTEWWKKTTVYQIYPRSWFDTNGDGIGDIQGIIEKLDYIQDLGYETIWISPFTKSPQRDFGYDISDYQAISPEYGNMQAVEKLIEAVHKRKMKIIFDLVMNHTSDEHTWFKESASSRNNPKADWYIWKSGRGGDSLKQPNNWRSLVGNKAWIYHPIRKQFYYAAFLPFQPDLNYNNPEVKNAMFDVVRFWLKKGIDGFRLDIIGAIYEDNSLKNNPYNLHVFPTDKSLSIYFQHIKNNFLQAQSFEFATELRSVIDEFPEPERFLVGESHGEEIMLKNFCEYKGKKGLKSVFLFKAISTPFKASAYHKMAQHFERIFEEPLLPTWVFGNHDRTRLFTRLGENVEKAKLLALFQFTARGIPFTYFGEELGIPNVKIPLKEGKDAIAIQQKHLPQWLADLSVEAINRDECRTPMLWTNQANAGFCPDSVDSWLPIAPNFANICVNTQKNDSLSLYHLYKKVISMRKNIPAFYEGSMQIAEHFCNRKLFAYYRMAKGEKYLVLLNMSSSKVKNPVSEGKLLFSTCLKSPQNMLQPYEGRVFAFL